MAAHKVTGDFGRKLREARERRGLSLRQIASATKISMLTLEALEKNDIARLPGGIFSRGVVRSYAIEVGLDPEETIQEFMGQFPQDSVTAGHPTTTRSEDHGDVESDRRMATTFLRSVPGQHPRRGHRRVLRDRGPACRCASSAGRAGVRAGGTVHPGDRRRQPPPADADRDAPSVVAGRAAVAPDGQDADRLVVQLKAVQRSWVSAIVDGQRAVQRVFQPGDEQTLDVRRDIVLTAGDGGAITVTLNGAAAKPIGPSGQTATTRLNLTNFKDYLLAP